MTETNGKGGALLDEVTNGEVVAPTPEKPQRRLKPWGYEELLVHGPYVVKRLHIDRNERLSLQYHERKIETMIVVNGTVEFEIEGVARRYESGDVVHLPAGVLHRATAIEGDVDIIEVSTPELDDIVRIEDDYGRPIQSSSR